VKQNLNTVWLKYVARNKIVKRFNTLACNRLAMNILISLGNKKYFDAIITRYSVITRYRVCIKPNCCCNIVITTILGVQLWQIEGPGK
jgi:hypothetical protein